MKLDTPPVPPDDRSHQLVLTTCFLRWSWMRALLHRGYWLVTSLYLVLDAGLSPFQLVIIGSAQALVSLLFEVPAGVVADTFSRKWSLVISHILIGVSMVATGLMTTFPALVATQMLWGLAWTFASGSDVAWVTDELGATRHTGRVLVAQARWEQIGGASGLIACGLFAWVMGRNTAMVSAGVLMALLGAYVAAQFPEHRFVPAPTQHWRAATTILRRGIALARDDGDILMIFVATFLINGAAALVGRVSPKLLVDLGFPDRPDPIVWFSGLGIVTFIIGALALHIIEARINQANVARHVYAGACGIGAFGVLLLTLAPDSLTASAGILLTSGIAWTVTRAGGAIWVNTRATRAVRATVHSLLAQVKYLGEIICGALLAFLAQTQTLAGALLGACILVACAGVIVARAGAEKNHIAAHE